MPQSHNSIEYQLKRARAHETRGNIDRSFETFQKIIEKYPNNEGAINQFRQFQERNPKYKIVRTSAANLNKIRDLMSNGQFGRAKRLGDGLLRQHPNDPYLMELIGRIYTQLGQEPVAVEFFRGALRVKPDYAQAHHNLGVVLCILNEYDSAIVSINKFLQMNPDDVKGLLNLGNALVAVERYKEAEKCFLRAIEIQPDFAEVHNNLGVMFNLTNRLSDFRAAWEVAAAQCAPDHPLFLLMSARLAFRERRFLDCKHALERIDAADLEEKYRESFHEMFGKCCDNLEEYDIAFSHFIEFNKYTKILTKNWENLQNHFDNKMEKLIKSYDKAKTANNSVPKIFGGPPDPAFMIGFPRSGTTLLDTILRSHSQINVVEEKGMINDVLKEIDFDESQENIGSMNDEMIANLRCVYFKELDRHIDKKENGKIIIDKLPLNIISVALINRIFPNAKYIFCIRHPADCVLSCFMQKFRMNTAMVNFIELEKSALSYDKVMNLWCMYKKLLILDIVEVKYEDVVNRFDFKIEEILNFLNLEWQDGVREYRSTAENRDYINTPSYHQVTRELYGDSIGRWRHYAAQMSPVLPVLQPWIARFGYD